MTADLILTRINNKNKNYKNFDSLSLSSKFDYLKEFFDKLEKL